VQTMRRTALAAVLALATLAASCGGEGSPTAQDTQDTTTTTAAPPVLRILASNDDGIGHPGLDLMVRRLGELPNVEVTVVAPAENRSGSSDATTDGEVSYSRGETASGVEGTAVDGLPADSIGVAIDELGLDPHLVVSGINDAQNIGPFAELSGTVGVVRTAVRRGVPGVAVSAGQFDEAQFEVAADLVIDWIGERRDDLVNGTYESDEAISFNIPSCDPEQMGELVEVPLAEEFPEGVNPFLSDCSLDDPEPADDYAAIRSGYPAMTRVPTEL
jgi:5'-nucleotidase